MILFHPEDQATGSVPVSAIRPLNSAMTSPSICANWTRWGPRVLPRSGPVDRPAGSGTHARLRLLARVAITPVAAGNAPCDECERIWGLERDFIARRLADVGREPSREEEAAGC